MFSYFLIQPSHVKHPNLVKTMAPAETTTRAAIFARVLLVLRAPIVKRVKYHQDMFFCKITFYTACMSQKSDFLVKLCCHKINLK